MRADSCSARFSGLRRRKYGRGNLEQPIYGGFFEGLGLFLVVLPKQLAVRQLLQALQRSVGVAKTIAG
jgi:hypothetical protein